MKLYEEYIKEREGKNLITKDYGFVTYKLEKDSIYLSDMYIRKEDRNKGYCDKLEDEVIKVGKLNKCKQIITSICLTAKVPGLGKSAIEKRDYKILGCDKPTNMIYYIKDI